MKLQVALDVEDINFAREILNDIVEYVDIVEIGLLFYTNGYVALEMLKKEFPSVEFLADVKISDGGNFCTKQAHRFGADYVTVLGVVDDETILGAVRAAEETGIKVVIDMVGCRNFYERVKELDAMGVQYINIHTPADLQAKNNTPFEHLEIAAKIVNNAKLSVAGGINSENISQVLMFRPDIIICGASLVYNDNRVNEAIAIRQAINKTQKEVITNE